MARSPFSRATPAVAVLAFLLALAAAGGDLRAASDPDGRSIMEEVDRRQRSASLYSEGELTVERRGKIRRKAWRSWRLGWGEDVRNLLQFTEPAEVRGVSLLTVRRRDRADEQWLYAPAIDRDRRITAREKGTRFLGTDFTYEDLQERDLESFDYRMLREEPVDGDPCWLVEGRPRTHKDSQYSRLLFWVRREAHVIVRIEGFVEGELRRDFRATDVRDVQGHPTPHRWEVRDRRRGSRTVLVLANVRYDVELDGDAFSLQGMHVLQPPPEPDR